MELVLIGHGNHDGGKTWKSHDGGLFGYRISVCSGHDSYES